MQMKGGWHLFAKIDDKGNYNWFMWAFASKDMALFVLDPTRALPRYHVKAYLI
ncbi:hypothetical protein ES707_03260 [subsurface metagenome]